MQRDVRHAILNALLALFRPLSRILLRYGLGCRDVYEVFKTAMVEVATEDYGIRNRPTNISRVAAMTGLTRKEVTRLRECLAQPPLRFPIGQTAISVVFDAWRQRRDRDGDNAAVLPFADDEQSFERLVTDQHVDIPPGAIRSELMRLGAIRADANGNLHLVRDSLMPDGDHRQLVRSLRVGVASLLTCVESESSGALDPAHGLHRTTVCRSLTRSDASKVNAVAGEALNLAHRSVDELDAAIRQLRTADAAGDRSVIVGTFVMETGAPMDDVT